MENGKNKRVRAEYTFILCNFFYHYVNIVFGLSILNKTIQLIRFSYSGINRN